MLLLNSPLLSFLYCLCFSTKPLYYTTISNFQIKYIENLTIISGLVWHNRHHMILIFSFCPSGYQPCNPKASAYYKCVENHFEELEQAWDDMYKSRYGYWRTYVMTVIYKYLDCGNLHFGFARVRCEDCGHKYLLAFSCKRRHFCPSCHQKRVVEYGE